MPPSTGRDGMASLGPMASPVDPHRLPRAVRPSRYDLRLRPDLDAATFEGRVRIDVRVDKATVEVVLNAAELEVDDATIRCGDEERSPRIALDEDTERLHLHLDTPCRRGRPRSSSPFGGS